MTNFSHMPFEFRAALGMLMFLFQVSAFAAKSPEDFVGPAATVPATSPAAPAAGNQKPPPKPAPVPQTTPGPASAKPAPDPASAKPVSAPVPAKPAPVPAPAKTPAAGKPAAAPKTSPKPMMDTAALHATYLEGDFDQAIRVMEGALKNKKQPLSHADSVFIFKHLGVMYAATPATREKGRYYMAQLIYIEPTAKILDMYASDMIYLIYRNVQEEFANKHPHLANPVVAAVDTTPKTEAPPSETKPAPVERGSGQSRKTIYWIAGGAVAVGVAGLLFVLLDSPEPKNHDIVLSE